MRTVIDCNLRGAPHVAIELAKQTLDLLYWGRQVWKNGSKDDRGAIFTDTFVRGVRVIYLEALMQVRATHLLDPFERELYTFEMHRCIRAILGKIQRPR
jgi:hypothetical protein